MSLQDKALHWPCQSARPTRPKSCVQPGRSAPVFGRVVNGKKEETPVGFYWFFFLAHSHASVVPGVWVLDKNGDFHKMEVIG